MLSVKFRRNVPHIEVLESRDLLAGDLAGDYACFASLIVDANPSQVKANANWESVSPM